MPIEIIPTFIMYSAVSAITPGPANLCSLASAISYGRKKALRQWRGIFTGFAVVSVTISVVVWFIGMAFHKWLHVLTWIGAAYILWLAWHILRSESTGQAEAREHCNFLTGFFVQLTNPKIMVFCATALVTYALPYADSYWDMLKIALLLPFLGGPIGNLVWLFAGAQLQRFFKDHRKIVNIVMALALGVCAVSIVLRG